MTHCANNGAREMKFGSFDSVEDYKYNGVHSVAISRKVAAYSAHFPLGRYCLSDCIYFMARGTVRRGRYANHTCDTMSTDANITVLNLEHLLLLFHISQAISREKYGINPTNDKCQEFLRQPGHSSYTCMPFALQAGVIGSRPY